MSRFLSIFTLGLLPALSVLLPVSANAQPRVYEEIDGVDSVRLVPEGLDVLESIGLSFVEGESTAEPFEGYTYGWDLLPPSSEPGVRGTTYRFLYDPETGFDLPLEGVEEFDGTLTFDVDTSKLALESQLIVGDNTIAFDDDFNFFAIDTVTTNARLTDLGLPSGPIYDIATNSWTVDGVDVFISQEFSDFLTEAGATQSVAGLKIAEAHEFRTFREVAAVPEPNVWPGLLATAVGLLALKKFKYISKKDGDYPNVALNHPA